MRSLIEGKSVPSREQLARETWDLLLESVLKGNLVEFASVGVYGQIIPDSCC